MGTLWLGWRWQLQRRCSLAPPHAIPLWSPGRCSLVHQLQGENTPTNPTRCTARPALRAHRGRGGPVLQPAAARLQPPLPLQPCHTCPHDACGAACKSDPHPGSDQVQNGPLPPPPSRHHHAVTTCPSSALQASRRRSRSRILYPDQIGLDLSHLRTTTITCPSSALQARRRPRLLPPPLWPCRACGWPPPSLRQG